MKRLLMSTAKQTRQTIRAQPVSTVVKPSNNFRRLHADGTAVRSHDLRAEQIPILESLICNLRLLVDRRHRYEALRSHPHTMDRPLEENS